MISHPDIYEHRRCRACQGALRESVNLGPLKLNAFPATRSELDQILAVPLILTYCTECSLVQLDRTVPPDWLYRQYWYRSGVNEMMIEELDRVVARGIEESGLGRGDRVLDVGANDGTLLSHYSQPGRPRVERVAVEPAQNLHDQLRSRCAILIPDYFPHGTQNLPAGGYRLITAVACAYDTEHPLEFFTEIARLLHPRGVAVVQFQDFAQQLTTTAFDNICHEHLEYYTLWSLTPILARAGLRVVRVEQTPINGGSLRVYLRPASWVGIADISLAGQLAAEASLGLDIPTVRAGISPAFAAFGRRIRQRTIQIRAALAAALDENRVVDVYGASTKGNILLQVLGLGPQEIRQAIDRSPEKTGRLTLTGIPIVGEEGARVEPADVWLCPIWQFRESALRRERWYLEQGGTILFPLPQVELVRESWRVPGG